MKSVLKHTLRTYGMMAFAAFVIGIIYSVGETYGDPQQIWWVFWENTGIIEKYLMIVIGVLSVVIFTRYRRSEEGIYLSSLPLTKREIYLGWFLALAIILSWMYLITWAMFSLQYVDRAATAIALLPAVLGRFLYSVIFLALVMLVISMVRYAVAGYVIALGLTVVFPKILTAAEELGAAYLAIRPHQTPYTLLLIAKAILGNAKAAFALYQDPIAPHWWWLYLSLCIGVLFLSYLMVRSGQKHFSENELASDQMIASKPRWCAILIAVVCLLVVVMHLLASVSFGNLVYYPYYETHRFDYAGLYEELSGRSPEDDPELFQEFVREGYVITKDNELIGSSDLKPLYFDLDSPYKTVNTEFEYGQSGFGLQDIQARPSEALYGFPAQPGHFAILCVISLGVTVGILWIPLTYLYPEKFGKRKEKIA